MREPEDAETSILPPVTKRQPGLIRLYTGACLIVFSSLVVIGLLCAGWVVFHGVSSRDNPTVFEETAARAMRHLAVPAGERRRVNPVLLTPESLAEGKAHWADHCASCHGNDGRGNTEIGRHLFPKAPDMTLSKTQALTDGELFAIIKNGVRLTGMPAWGSLGSDEDPQTWKLVLFIRHLRNLTPEELDQMKSMNPVSPMELEEQRKADDFLSGGDAPELASPPHHPARPRASRKEIP